MYIAIGPTSTAVSSLGIEELLNTNNKTLFQCLSLEVGAHITFMKNSSNILKYFFLLIPYFRYVYEYGLINYGLRLGFHFDIGYTINKAFKDNFCKENKWVIEGGLDFSNKLKDRYHYSISKEWKLLDFMFLKIFFSNISIEIVPPMLFKYTSNSISPSVLIDSYVWRWNLITPHKQ